MLDRELYDVIVVGSGAAGGWAAKELTENGLTVLLLEAGRAVTPEADFPMPPPPERRLLSRVVGILAGQHIQTRYAGFNERTRDFFVNDRENPYTTPLRNPYNSPSGAFLPGTAIHEMGGAGMGDDPKKFVLNRFNQCWDAPNVFVTDGACFVSGCCQNTTLTIMALTARACDYIVQKYGAGRLQELSSS